MVRRDSSNSDVLKLENLMRDYIAHKGYLLKDEENIKGSNLVDALDNLNFKTEEEFIKKINENSDLKVHYEEKSKEYAELEEKYKKLEEGYKGFLDTLGLILKNPIFSSIEGLIKIIRETEEKVEKRRF